MTHVRSAFLWFLVLAQLFFVAASVGAHRTRPQGLIASDGKAYYAWLRSLALDRDLDFRNDYQLLFPPDPVPAGPYTARGLINNKYPVGTAIVTAPGFLVGHAIAAVSGMPTNGVSAPYQFAVVLWLQALCLAGLALLWASLLRLGADPVIAALGVVGALAATNLIQYAARPAMAHAPGLAVLCLALYVSVTAARPARPGRLAIIGALLGLAAIIRPSNVALAPFFAVLVWPLLERKASSWIAFAAAFCGVVFVQVAFASTLWGRLTFSGYVDEGFTSGIGGVVNALVSARHGLFVYHPAYLLLLALVAAAIARPATRRLAVAALASFLALATINGTWWSWWFGDGFGNRAFIESLPILLVPATLWLSERPNPARTRGAVAAVVVVLGLANALLWTGFVLRRYPPDGRHAVADAYLWPWRD